MVAQQLQDAQQQSQVATQTVALTEQENARLKTQLADKQRDLQLELQKSQWDHEISLQENALKDKELNLKYHLQAVELAQNAQSAAQNGQAE